MHARWLPPVAAVTLLLAGCGAGPGRSGGGEGDEPSSDAERFRLDETVSVELPTGRRFEAEVARSASEQARGLMFRPTLGADEAMIFPYESPRPLSIWMRDVEFPIDVLFLRSTGDPTRLAVASMVENVPPCRRSPCPSYPSEGPARYFLELPAFTISAEGLVRGDVIRLGRPLLDD